MIANLFVMSVFGLKKAEPFKQTKLGNEVTLQLNPAVKDSNSGSVICSHEIFVALLKTLPKFAYTVLHDEHLPKLDYNQFGVYTPEDIVKTAKYLQDLFVI